MDFSYSEKVEKLRAKLLAFMDEHVYPNETEAQAVIGVLTRLLVAFGLGQLRLGRMLRWLPESGLSGSGRMRRC